jgi:uracil-DNA glycosylase family 4
LKAIGVPRIPNCPGCPYATYGPAIGSDGDPASRSVLVGEAPGASEVVEGRPFVGPAGQLLRGALAQVGLVEADLFITNAVACRPYPVKPWVRAIVACHERLATDLSAHPRAVIVTLGATAMRAVTAASKVPMLEVRGRPLSSPWGPVLPTLHPARVLRRPEERALLVGDLRTAAAMAAESVERDGVLYPPTHR